MFQMQFHSGFIPSDSRYLKFARHELDHLDTSDQYPEAFLGIAQPKPAQHSMEYDGIRIAGDQPESNLFEAAQLTETLSGSNCRRGIVETTYDLLGGAEWSSEQPAENLIGGITLLDFGEPSNFDLLVGDVSGSNQDLFGGEKQNPFIGAAEDSVATSAPPQHEQQSNRNQFDLFSSSLGDSSIPQDSSSSASASSSSSSAAAAALLFDSFIPFHSTAVPTPAAAAHVASNLSEKTTISSSSQNQTKPSAEDDFLTSFLEIKPEEDETSNDLLGQWNASNITSSAGPGMMMGAMPPRPCTSRSDLKSSDQTASVPHNNNSSSGMENLFGQAGQKIDPFRDLGNLAGLKPGLGNGDSNQNKNMMKNASGSSLTNTGRSSSPMMMAAGVTSPIGSGTPAWQPSTQHQTIPNYSAGGQPASYNAFAKPTATTSFGFSSVIGSRDEQGQNKPFGPIPKVDEHTFEDLLERQKFMPAKKEPRTINEMRKTLDVKTTDPDTLKVRGWIDGKESNIRTLLCSLHTVLWTDEERWKEVGMHELISPDQVKEYYRKAVLSVHPDRLLPGHPHKELARLIFIELNDAWTEFKKTGMKPLYS